jgi:hypothetical protein
VWCPQCRAEYREGFAHCPDCDVDLTVELPPREVTAVIEPQTAQSLVEYPLEDLSNDQRKLLELLLGRAELRFTWERPHRLIVALDSADKVDEILDLVDASGRGRSPHRRRGNLVDKIIEVLEAKWLILIGLVVIVLGVVDLIWTQIDTLPGGSGVHIPIGYRWYLATGPIGIMALGVLVVVGAQIMVAVQDAFLRDDDSAELPPPEAPLI